MTDEEILQGQQDTTELDRYPDIERFMTQSLASFFAGKR